MLKNQSCLFVAVSIFLCSLSEAASFNCQLARTNVERTICNDSQLSLRDSELSAIYKNALSNTTDKESILLQQRNWLKKVRNTCTNTPCLTEAYATRAAELGFHKQADNEQLKLIKNHFAANDYAMTIQATEALSDKLQPMTGVEYIAARYALWDLALDISKNTSYPSESRLALLKAVAFIPSEGRQSMVKEEIHAGVRILIDVGKIFKREQNDIAGGLDALLLALQLNQKLADTDRLDLQFSGIEYLLPEPYEGKPKPYIDKVAALAELTRDDKSLEWFRQKIVSDVYYGYHYLWVKTGSSFTTDGDDREIILERCKNLLRLVAALENISECKRGCGGTGWSWRPIMSVAAAYEWIDMPDEGSKYIDKALQLVKNITDKDRLLYEYRFVFSELCGIHYRSKNATERERVRSLILSFAEEMTNLANSLNTQNAKEVRESLGKKLEEANLI